MDGWMDGWKTEVGATNWHEPVKGIFSQQLEQNLHNQAIHYT